MARPPAPPGPPPPHHRPPGTPRPPADLPPALRPQPALAPPRDGGIGAGAATAVATVTLLIGLVVGFFLGRAYDADEETGSAVATVPASPPSTSGPTGDTIPQAPPGAPPSTDLPPTGLGTLEEPIPAGQAYVLGLYEIEVRSAARDATELLQAHEPANPAPPAGQQHVLVEVAVRFTDAAGLGNPAAIPFFVSDGTDEWSAVQARCGAVPDPLADAGLLEQGDEVVGNVCFTVPAGAADDLVLGTESFAGALWFALP